MSKDEKCTCKACKSTVFHCQICKFVTFLLPSSSWLLKFSIHASSRGLEGRLFSMSRASIITAVGSNEIGNRIKSDQANEYLKLCLENGIHHLDTSHLYTSGKSEEIIGNSEMLDDSKVEIATKAFPYSGRGFKDHAVLDQMNESLERLKKDCVDLFYLHFPDHSVPIEETLKDVNLLYKEGKFKSFGLSNYSAWEVAEIYYLCKINNYPLPSVYQGRYNSLSRGVERELIPCLRRLGISFYAYSPLAGGLLTGKHYFEDRDKETIQQGRYSGDNARAKFYRSLFWKKPMFDALDTVKVALDHVYGPGKVSLADASIRWMYHHSILDGAHGDAVIIGASSIKHLEENIKSTKHGPLHEDIVKAFEEAWNQSKTDCPLYYRYN